MGEERELIGSSPKVHCFIRSRPTPFHRGLGTCGPVFAFANGPIHLADVA
jgi:hypothetical protein